MENQTSNRSDSQYRFAGRVVLVTGAGRGIGRTVARTYAELGAQVVCWDKDADLLNEARAQYPQAFRDAVTATVDVGKPDEIARGVREVVDAFGRIDILINNAGISHWKSPIDLAVAEWDEVIHVNLRGTFLCAREAAQHMAKGSAIVNLASTRGIMSEPNSEAYAASKGGILALTHALAASFGPRGIRVNAISPGWIETGDYEALGEADHAQHFAGRVGHPGDIAKACLYLTDPDNDFVTGINLVVDGGMTRKMIYVE